MPANSRWDLIRRLRVNHNYSLDLYYCLLNYMGRHSPHVRQICPFSIPSKYSIFLLWRCVPTWAMTSVLRFPDHTQRRTTVGRISLGEWSARRTDLYLTKHNTQQINIHTPRRNSNPQSQQASGHWDRLVMLLMWISSYFLILNKGTVVV